MPDHIHRWLVESPADYARRMNETLQVSTEGSGGAGDGVHTQGGYLATCTICGQPREFPTDKQLDAKYAEDWNAYGK